MGGNFFGTRIKYGRYDANKGELFLGDGHGNFQYMNQAKSGIALTGEVRDITLIRSGDSYLVLIARNNDDLKTYKVEEYQR